ncbi:MAG: tol-pal system protein YbgF [Myxococcota bacterium]
MESAVRWVAAAALLAMFSLLSGCVTVAEFRKLEHQVAKLQGARGPGGHETQQVADLTLEIEELREELAQMEGRVDLAQHQAEEALTEARHARKAAVGGSPGAEPPSGAATPPEEGSDPLAGVSRENAPAAEIAAYREAYSAWRAGDTRVCIDRFQQFLQTYASSAYADDAAFWMADCYFREGDYRAAILRFDDVASGYPTGNKAADALYRQGEALMRLGPGYANAARRAFERVIEEYPDSPRVPEARRQLEALGKG